MKMNFVLTALIAAAIGFLIGLSVGAIKTESLGAAIKERDELRGQITKLQEETADKELQEEIEDEEEDIPEHHSEWGPLAQLAEHIGPGSAFHRFATKLIKKDVWKPDRYYWCVAGPLHSPKVHMMLTEVGEGKVYMEGIVLPHSGTMYVVVVFKPGETADLHEAVLNRNTCIREVARAMELTDEELARLDAVISIVPLVRAADPREEMLQFVAALPDRVETRFRRCALFQAAGSDAARVAGMELDSDGPTIGFPLSDRYLLELAFMDPWGTVIYEDTNYLEVGPWWSVLIHDPVATDFSSAEEPQKSEDGTMRIDWPRLTLEEVDAIRELISR